ncbi:PST family polysaccharide transporter [Apilactobacillus kunkeei]|uniref:putative polysaccharide biosynthesis protein n=1 Tax=Apilactobacillus kunkeei TaxID=148814 RepID=UPI0006C2FA9D|nr:oligosaccharide flippase family protein [Apilactobacillus kunkeei]KOY75416.1 PST family polysaccharide transporter [Apilactobacillus kunkeei]
MKNDNKLSVIMKGAMILSIASLISKVLSAVYRVPFQNLVGNIGFYVFQQVYPIYGIGMVLALSGMPIIISRVIAEQETTLQKKALLRQLFIMLSIFGGLIFIICQIKATSIAALMGDIRLDSLIRAVSWMFLMMPILACLRGYFQATLIMKPTAYSQVVEQVIRVGLIIAAAYVGVRHHVDPYTIGTYAMVATPVAEIFSVAILIRYYAVDIKRLPSQKVMSYQSLFKRLLFEGGTICMLSSLMVLMQLVDSFTVRKGLLLNGLNLIDSQAVKGIYDRGQPLVQLGLVIATSFASAILPSLSLAYSKKQMKSFHNLASEMLRVSMFMTVGVAVGMISLMPLINRLLFNSGQQNTTISIFMISVVLTTMITIYSSILQSANHFKITIIAIILGLAAKILITKEMVAHMGIAGASISTVISLLLMLIVEVKFAPTDIVKIENKWSFLWKLTVIAIVMLVIEMILINLFGAIHLVHSKRLSAIISLCFLVPIGAAVFGVLAIKWKLLTYQEWQSVPVVNKFIDRWMSK